MRIHCFAKADVWDFEIKASAPAPAKVKQDLTLILPINAIRSTPVRRLGIVLINVDLLSGQIGQFVQVGFKKRTCQITRTLLSSPARQVDLKKNDSILNDC
jgi:hypothetical protein